MRLLLGKMEEQLKHLPDNSVDSIVTDPPYGISFMGKGWDHGVPGKEMWEEAIRVLKPGGYLISFSSARTYHRSTVAIEDAGFEIRDQIMWVYAQGFPKNKSQLKPAHEPITVARKKFKGTCKANVEKWGVGTLNIDDCRVGDERVSINQLTTGMSPFGAYEGGSNYETKTVEGRYPSNLIHDGSQQVLDLFPDSQGGHWPDSKTTGGGESWGGKSEYHGTGPKDNAKGSAARFFYVPKVNKKDRNEGLTGTPPSFSDCGKSQPTNVRDRCREIAEGKVEVDGLVNTHPTVKPTDLMHYLIRMVTPAGGVVLDPFMGSGSTGKAAIRHGYDFIGIEMEQESYDVAKARIEWEQEK